MNIAIGHAPAQAVRLDDLNGGPDTLVLCATARLAQHLRLSHAQGQAERGMQRWDSLNCCTTEQWLAAWREAWLLGATLPKDPVLARRALSSSQERLLWERIVRQHLGAAAADLFDLSTLAQSAEQAHALQTVWQVDGAATPLQEEHQQFQRWRSSFLRWCAEHGWATRHELDRASVLALTQPVPGLPWPRLVVLAGHNRLNPIERDLLTKLPGLGIGVATCADAPDPSQIEVRSYPDRQAECLAAAAWAQALIEQDPGLRLALVVPDLAALREPLHNTLEDLLAPWLARPEHAEAQRPFNFSLGRPLNEYALVGAALTLLDAIAQPEALTQTELSHLLRRPYCFGPDTALLRAEIDAEMRRQLPARLSWGRLAAIIETQRSAQTPAGRHCLQQVQALGELSLQTTGPRLPSAWAPWLGAALQRVGWLHGCKLSSHEYQVREAFDECWAEWEGLDLFTGPLTLAQALSRLRQLCRERIFQPQTQGQQPLQVLGLLEASGQRFDAVWVMGLESGIWPPPAQPNPLLPSAAQRRAGSPNASAEVQIAFARQVQAQLVHAAPSIVLSWPRQDGATELHPSPLLAGLPATQPCAPPAVAHWVHAALSSGTRWLAPPLDDSLAPALQAHEKLRGGAALLRAQAICPAWAYYRYRLGAGRLEEAAQGLDARQRGTLLHGALEHLWQHVQTGQALRALSAPALEHRIELATAAAWATHDAQTRHEPVAARTRKLETQRLQRLLQAWLALERDRPHDFTVVATELRQQIPLPGLTLQVQIDRIDELADGRRLIIDYKTGTSVDTKNWASERLSEPQLPLYAVWLAATGADVAGVAFAKVLLKDPGWSGLAACAPPGTPVASFDGSRERKQYPVDRFPAWPQVLAHWQACLDTVADEIRAGVAAVRCSDETLLRHCDVLALLRLSERRQQWQARADQPSQSSQPNPLSPQP